jgi:hypothetical protein
MAERRGFRLDLVRISAALPVGALLEPVLMRATTTRRETPQPSTSPIGAVQPVVSLRGAIHPAQ